MLVKRRTGANAEDVVVDEVVVLTRRLVDAIHVGRSNQMRFADWQRVGTPVYLPCASVDDLHGRIASPTRFEEREVAATVDVEIVERVAHAVDVTHLSRQVEDDVVTTDQRIHRRLIAEVGVADPNTLLDAGDVERVATVVRNQ
jgi:hypothetical protein